MTIDDVLSNNSSIEICDSAINESWDWTKSHKKFKSETYESVRINVGEPSPPVESVLDRTWRYFNEHTIRRRVLEFEKRETKIFNSQRIQKMQQICEDEETKKALIQDMMCAKNQELLDDTYDVLKRKYGANMAECLVQHSKFADTSLQAQRRRIHSIASTSILEGPPAPGLDEVEALKRIDPLCNWLHQKSDISGRMLARVQNLASSACAKVKWSMLIEPGRPQTDLSSFYTEFDILETFFDKVELSPKELSQKAFDASYVTKARNRKFRVAANTFGVLKIVCVDCSRVKLTIPEELTKDGVSNDLARRPQPSDIFGDCDCPQVNIRGESGYGDFIHANYVIGGPLVNKFILTQAPLSQTIPDFWRMIWQEKSEYIFMLCEASDTQTLGIMSTTIPECCPYYWPKYEGESMKFGRLIIRNEGLDATLDPLFNVTRLVLWMEDEPGNRLKLQHWQWDWRNFTDFHWPLRLLIRSRHSKFPTVVHCMDGCGRSGTLVLIEIFLMQLLRGTTSYENTMLTSAVFLRLQRRNAVSNQMQYLFAYRTVLHWAEPYIVSRYHRLVLGYLFRNSGLAGKYDQIALIYLRKTKT